MNDIFKNFLHFFIKPVDLPYSNSKKGNITFLEYQREVINATDKAIFIDAPTGAGKTLAILGNILRIFEEEKGDISLIIYPTNELMDDQLKSLGNLLSKMSEKYTRYFIDDLGNVYKEGYEEGIALVCVNGDVLSFINRSHGEVIRKMLNLDVRDKIIMLTNIDMLYSILKGMPKFSKDILLKKLIPSTTILAVDEFHLYYGSSLATLVFLIDLFSKSKNFRTIFSSATLTESSQLIMDITNNIREIKAYENHNKESRRVRHKCEIFIGPIPGGTFLYSDNDLENIVKYVSYLYENAPKDIATKVVVILNSIVFAEKVADKLEEKYGEKVSRINSMVPREYRNRNADIVVGTSAIELGIDFDTYSLIFEANESEIFIQRLGRVARHREGKAIALIPPNILRKLRNKIKNIYEISYSEFIKIIKRTLKRTENYVEFIKSEGGAKLYLSFIHALVSHIEGQVNLARSKNIAIKWAPNFINKNSLRKIDINNGYNIKIIHALMSCMPRGNYVLPAFSLKYKKFLRIDLTQLNNIKFKIDTVDNICNKYDIEKKPYWIKSPHAVIIKGFEKRKCLAFTTYRSIKNWKIVLFRKENFALEDNDKLKKILLEKYKNIIGMFVNKPHDWRFSYIKSSFDNRYVIIGGDTLIQYYLEKVYK